MTDTTAPLVSVTDLTKQFVRSTGLFAKSAVHAVAGVSFTLQRRQTLALVGESGCGKSTLGRCILRLIEPTSGQIEIDGVDVLALGREPLRQFRRRAQIIFQDPSSSLNPRLRIGDALAEPLTVHGMTKTRAETQARVIALLEAVGLDGDAATKYPHAFSGGQRQRIGIARALTVEPLLIVADEPVSALDVSVQAQIVNLLVDLQTQRGLSYLFISHDLKVVRHLADEVAVMYLGRIVERAPASVLYAQPRHPYTETLLGAVLVADPQAAHASTSAPPIGEPPSPASPPPGCHYHPRCPRYLAKGSPDVCRRESPSLNAATDNAEHLVACHFAEG